MTTWQTAGTWAVAGDTQGRLGISPQQVLLAWCERRGVTEPRELDHRTLNQLTLDLVEMGGRWGKLSRFTVDTYVRNVNLFLGWCHCDRTVRWRSPPAHHIRSSGLAPALFQLGLLMRARWNCCEGARKSPMCVRQQSQRAR
jgi:hypothetical protein